MIRMIRLSIISLPLVAFLILSPTFANNLAIAVQGRKLTVPTPAPQPGKLPKGVSQKHFQFVRIPAGTVLMGSPDGEADRNDDETQHQVIISRPFEMQSTEVTQALWQAVMGSNLSEFKGPDLPVENVSWEDVQQFIAKLNQMLGTKMYRLPTEAEWEYAARAGTTTPFWTGENLTTDQANYNGTYPYGNNPKGKNRARTIPVKSFPPNAWGLYDMNGNLSEWVQDWNGVYPSGSVTDPMGPNTGTVRLYRGGSWLGIAARCRSAHRGGNVPDLRGNNVGFRLSRSST